MAVNRKLSRPSWNRYPARALSHQLLNPCFIAYARLAHISDTDTLPYLFPISSSSLSLFLLGKEDNSSLLSFLPHFFSPLYIYSIMLSIVPSFPNFQHKRILRKESRFRFALVVYFHRGIFRPGSFRIDPRYPADGIAQREFSKRGEVTLRISRVFSFLFFPFLSLFPPGCLAAFPPPESGWCPILGINRVARSVCQMLHVL